MYTDDLFFHYKVVFPDEGAAYFETLEEAREYIDNCDGLGATIHEIDRRGRSICRIDY